MPNGSVKWFDAQKGFGYISPEGGGPDVFVHRSVLPPETRSLAEGQAVEYDVESTPRGARAVRITLK